MASKRDELQAHQFLSQRAVSALVIRETDPAQPPFRRAGAAALGGIALAVLSLGAVGVYGLISPGGDNSWQDGKSVIVEKETGTRYVYLNGQLDQVANYASALLALGGNANGTAVTSVSRASLAGVTRGPRIGIRDAPDALPDPDKVLTGGWTLCSTPETDNTGATVDRSTLLVGTRPDGGFALGDRALLVQVPGAAEEYLVDHGHRHRIAPADVTAVSVALGSPPVTRIGSAAVDVLPDGADLAPIPLPEAGKPSHAVPGRAGLLAGQLLELETPGGTRYYLTETGGLLPITELQYDIQLAYGRTTEAYAGAEPVGLHLTPIEASAAVAPALTPPRDDDAPARRPTLADPGVADAPVCLTFTPGSGAPQVTVNPLLPSEKIMAATPRRTDDGVALADRVLVPPGSVAVIESMPGADAPSGTLAVVTDLGWAYPLAAPDVLGTLGYAGVVPVRVPAELVARVPQGPSLNHDDAMRQW
jgi:type VII secretion protein EccB